MTAALTEDQKLANKAARRERTAATHATNAPVRRAAPVANVTGTRPEIYTGDMKMGQLPNVDLGLDADLSEQRDTVIVPADAAALDKDYTAALAFAEEGVRISIAKSQEKNAPNTIYCAIDGRGAEVWDEVRKRWFVMGWLPTNRIMLVKRKYVEVLMRARKIDIQTEVGTTNDENPKNEVVRNVQQVNSISIIGDTNPDQGKVQEWARRIMTEAL